MTRLIIQIPCYNEAASLGETLSELPREVPGTTCVEWLVVDDGSTDGTSEVARRLGVDHVVRHARNRGLAQAFRTGIDACLRLGADIIVNTDADNQYPGTEIPRLIQPILEGRADVVIGDRRTRHLDHFSPTKKILQRFGSFVVRRLSGTDVPDAVSGFRAISRRAATELNIISNFSYTIEMIIQAGKKRLAIVSVPVPVNPRTRRSRLFRSLRQFVTLSAATMIRTYTMYQPLRVFTSIGLLLAIVGAAPALRFLYFYLEGEGAGHVQSLVLGGTLLVVGLITMLIGVVADLIAANRRLLEMILERQRGAAESGSQESAPPKADRKDFAKMTDSHQEDPLVPPRDLVSKHCIGERDFREIGEIMVRGYLGRGYIQPDSRVLDVGCGLGRLARPLTTFLSERGEYQGLDIHQGSIEWCQSRYSQIPNFHFKWADLYSGEYNPQGKFNASEYSFPYDTEQFDFVILSSVFTHMLLDGVANYLAEISRVLKFGGRCAITYFLLTPKLLNSFGKSWFRIDGGLVPNKEIPEIMTALQEDVVRSIYDANGLEIEHIYYGEWCGRPLVGAGFQDQIVAKKVDRDWEPRVVVDVEAKEEQ